MEAIAALTVKELMVGTMVASAVGTGISAMGQYQSSRMQEEAAERNAEIAKRDAAIKQSQYDRDARRVHASEMNKMAGRGLLLTSGSSLGVLADIAAQQQEQSLLIKYGGAAEAYQSTTRAKSYGAQARASAIGGAAKMGSGLLSSYYNYRKG